jgi:hypothetical protein
MKSPEAEAALFDIASLQEGYFTARQAVAAGYSQKNHHYYVKNGDWVKEWRGIYRLSRYPDSVDGQYVLWSLWSRDRNETMQGGFSHETALSMFELSDVNPEKIHMTVPPGFRRSAETPQILVLHKRIVRSDDWEQRSGFRVMKPIPNILMLIEEGIVSEEILLQAIKDGILKGHFIKAHLEKMEAPDNVKKDLISLLKRTE